MIFFFFIFLFFCIPRFFVFSFKEMNIFPLPWPLRKVGFSGTIYYANCKLSVSVAIGQNKKKEKYKKKTENGNEGKKLNWKHDGIPRFFLIPFVFALLQQLSYTLFICVCVCLCCMCVTEGFYLSFWFYLNPWFWILFRVLFRVFVFKGYWCLQKWT